MNKEKILILYSTLIRPGLAISHFMQPDPIIYDIDLLKPISLYITTVLLFDSSKHYMTELDIVFNGESVLPTEGNPDNAMVNFMSSKPDDNSLVVGSSLFLQGINISKNGVYDVNFSLFEDDDGKLGKQIDSKQCSFVVARSEKEVK